MSPTPKIVVVGSFMTDLVFRTERRPQRGETVIGKEFGLFTGGKGYNQAVAAVRMGARVAMVGRLGRDMFGDLFIQSLAKEGIDCSFVWRDADSGTGVACPVIDISEGDNSIIIVPRANMRLTPDDIDAAAGLITTCDVLMMQLENPLESVMHAAYLAHSAGVKVMLNPAPARALPAEIFPLLDVITPNEIEATQLTGIDASHPAGALQAARSLRSMGTQRVILSLGQRGALMVAPEGETQADAFRVEVVDPTAAGDAFCAGLAVALAQGLAPAEALRSANAAGALACTVLGAEPSMPTAEKIKQFLSRTESLRH
jgi:ribokinase